MVATPNDHLAINALLPAAGWALSLNSERLGQGHTAETEVEEPQARQRKDMQAEETVNGLAEVHAGIAGIKGMLALPDEILLAVADYLLEEAWELHQRRAILVSSQTGYVDGRPVVKYDLARGVLRSLYCLNRRMRVLLEPYIWHTVNPHGSAVSGKDVDGVGRDRYIKMAAHVRSVRMEPWLPVSFRRHLDLFTGVRHVSISTGNSSSTADRTLTYPKDLLLLSRMLEVLMSSPSFHTLQSLQIFGYKQQSAEVWRELSPSFLWPVRMFKALRTLDVGLVVVQHALLNQTVLPYEDLRDEHLLSLVGVLKDCGGVESMRISTAGWPLSLARDWQTRGNFAALKSLHVQWAGGDSPAVLELVGVTAPQLERLQLTIPSDSDIREIMDEFENRFAPAPRCKRLREIHVSGLPWEEALQLLGWAWFKRSPLQEIILYDPTPILNDTEFSMSVKRTADLVTYFAEVCGTLRFLEVHAHVSHHRRAEELRIHGHRVDWRVAAMDDFAALVGGRGRRNGAKCSLHLYP